MSEQQQQPQRTSVQRAGASSSAGSAGAGGGGGNASPASKPATPQLNVKWDDSNMRSHYANVVNAAATREEVMVMFGVHGAWQNNAKEITVQLAERVILSPYAAKRLHVLLGTVLKEYESRYGALKLESTPGQVGEIAPAASAR